MLRFDHRIIDVTLNYIQAGAQNRCETAVLWLGRRSETESTVTEVFRPHQIVDHDFFKIPPEGMRALLAHLRQQRLQILAQVHSHPARAFHSDADNAWAVVRHVGALSLVIPWFGARTTIDSFMSDIVTFRLDADDVWREVPSADVLRIA